MNLPTYAKLLNSAPSVGTFFDKTFYIISQVVFYMTLTLLVKVEHFNVAQLVCTILIMQGVT